MQVDSELASQLGLSPGDLFRLDRWRRRCQQAIEVVKHLLQLFVLSDVSRLCNEIVNNLNNVLAYILGV